MSGEDYTRRFGLAMQGGVSSSKAWTFGPFSFTVAEFPKRGFVYGLNLQIGRYGFQIGGWAMDVDSGHPGARDATP